MSDAEPLTVKPLAGVYIAVPTRNYYGFIRLKRFWQERIPVESYRRRKPKRKKP